MLRLSLIGLGGLLLVGDLSYLSVAAVSVSTAVLERSFSREQEIEADAYSARYFLERGQDPALLAKALQNLSDEAETDDGGWLNTHPATEDRVRLIQSTED